MATIAPYTAATVSFVPPQQNITENRQIASDLIALAGDEPRLQDVKIICGEDFVRNPVDYIVRQLFRRNYDIEFERRRYDSEGALYEQTPKSRANLAFLQDTSRAFVIKHLPAVLESLRDDEYLKYAGQTLFGNRRDQHDRVNVFSLAVLTTSIMTLDFEASLEESCTLFSAASSLDEMRYAEWKLRETLLVFSGSRYEKTFGDKEIVLDPFQVEDERYTYYQGLIREYRYNTIKIEFGAAMLPPRTHGITEGEYKNCILQ